MGHESNARSSERKRVDAGDAPQVVVDHDERETSAAPATNAGHRRKERRMCEEAWCANVPKSGEQRCAEHKINGDVYVKHKMYVWPREDGHEVQRPQTQH